MMKILMTMLIVVDQRCIYMKIWPKEVNVVNTQKLIIKSKYTQKKLNESITNTQPLSSSAQVI